MKMEMRRPVHSYKKLSCDISLQQLEGIANSVHMGAFVIMGSIDSRADETVTDIISGAQGSLHIGAIMRVNINGIIQLFLLCKVGKSRDQIIVIRATAQQVLDSGKIHPMIIAARFHGFYEYLHPFRDGNGRLGRLMSNFILLKKEQPLLIIPGSQREEYITALKYIKKERTDEFLIDFFFRTSIKRMEQEIEEKKNLTENFIRGMEFVRNVKSSNDDILEI